MKLLTFTYNGVDKVGILANSLIYDVHAGYALLLQDQGEVNPYLLAEVLLPPDMLRLLQQGNQAIGRIQETVTYLNNQDAATGLKGEKIVYQTDEVQIKAPLKNPGKIICVGLNYFDHCEETGMEPPKTPIIFSKYSNAIIGTEEKIILPINANEVDFEAELAFVIGKKAKKVSREDALDYVAGYTILNDISARDMQFGDGQWIRGKTPDTFAPIGPVIVTKEEIADPHQLNIRLSLNGTVMQDSNTKNLIFDIPTILAYLSQSMTLEPGDIIATGTPPGVGMGRDPKVWLKPGDDMIVEVEGIGELRNTVVADHDS